MKCGDHYSPSPSTLIDILRWASENRETAEATAEGAERLNETGKREFEYYMFKASYKPDEALKRAFEMQLEDRARRSLLSKAIAHAKRDGYILKLPNGLECKMTYDGDYYVFQFWPGGVDVKILHNGDFLGEALNSLSRFSTFSSGMYGIEAIIIDGKRYSRRGKTGRIILEAIRRNINPYIYMTVEGNE